MGLCIRKGDRCRQCEGERHLEDWIELLVANDGALLKRLLHRLLHVATFPNIPSQVAVESGLRIYLEGAMRFPILDRWGPMGRFLDAHAPRVGAPIVARVYKTWLGSLPTMLADQPMLFRASWRRSCWSRREPNRSSARTAGFTAAAIPTS